MPRRQRNSPRQPASSIPTQAGSAIAENHETYYRNISADYGGSIWLNNMNHTDISADGTPLNVIMNRKETYEGISASDGASVSIGNHFNHVNNHTVLNTGHGGSGINTDYYHGTSASQGQKPRTSSWRRLFCGGASSDSDDFVAVVSRTHTRHPARFSAPKGPAPGLHRHGRNGRGSTSAQTGVWPLDRNAPSVFNPDSGVWPFDANASPFSNTSHGETRVNTGALGTSSYGVHQSSKCTQTFGRSTHDCEIDVGNRRYGPGSKPSFELVNGRVTKIGQSRKGDAVCTGTVAPATGMREASGPLLPISANSRPGTLATNANSIAAVTAQTRTRQRRNRSDVT